MSSTCLTNPWFLSTFILYTVILFCTLPLRETWIHATHISNWQCQPMAEWHYTTRCMMACALSQCMSLSLHILARFRELCICEQVRLFTATHAWSAQLLGNKVQLLRRLDNFGPNWSKQRCQDMYSTPPWRFQKSFSSTMSTLSQNAPHLCLVFPHLCLCLQTIALFSRLLCNSRPLDITSAYTSVLMTLPYVILSAHGLLYANIFHQYSVAIAWCIPATSGPKIYIYLHSTHILWYLHIISIDSCIDSCTIVEFQIDDSHQIRLVGMIRAGAIKKSAQECRLSIGVNYICHLHLSIPRSLPLRSSVPYPLCLPSISAPTMSRDQKRIWCCICLLNHLIVAGCFILISDIHAPWSPPYHVHHICHSSSWLCCAVFSIRQTCLSYPWCLPRHLLSSLQALLCF